MLPNTSMPKEFIPIQTLTLVAACGCNLKCKYCQIAMNVNDNSQHLLNDTRKALEDGSYAQNVLLALKNLHQAPTYINNLEIWGQEPSLILDSFTIGLENWLHAFPNIRHLFFSTNGMQHIDRIVACAKKLDDLVDKPFQFELQVSYDGDISTDGIRGASGDIIQTNIANLIQDFNSYNFKHLRFDIHLHGVTSIELIKQLDTTDKIFNYYEEATNWAQYLMRLNRNKMVSVDEHVSFYFETPMIASTEDGLLIRDFYRRSCAINPKLYTHPVAIGSVIDMQHMFKRALTQLKNTYAKDKLTDDDILKILSHPEERKTWDGFIRNLSGTCFCCSFVGELKIMYDGTCVLCQNTLFNAHDTKPPIMETEMKTGVFEDFYNHHFYINPITDSEEQVQKILDIHKDAKTSSFMIMYNTVINLMLWLLKAHQIDNSYRNLDKLLLHALYLTVMNSCSYNHYIVTGSLFGKDTGLLRAYCNGWIDDALDPTAVWMLEDLSNEKQL